ncbi:MAG: phage DNA ejection protein [Symbiopectobacterium sp.]|uniref:phage DNA ejection protein n=1 Tax=Symbiopectobacterium sp. TaxID=2952789 RepID=UPI0039EBE213
MATTQPWATGGSMLAGIGGNNTNAPQASDVNATLGLIRQNNEFARAGGNNVGLQALQGLKGLSDAYKQDQLQKAQAAFNQAHANAWKSGDTSALRDFAVKNPAFVTQAQAAVSHLGEEQRKDIGNLAAGMRVSLAQGPEAFSKFVNSNTGTLGRVGADPNTVLQMGINNPQAAQKFVDTLGMSSLGGKDYFDIVDKQQGRVIDRDKIAVDRERLAETARSNRAGEAVQWANVGIAQQNVNVRKLELQDKALDRQIARETNQVQLGVLQDKRAATQRELEQAKSDKADAYNTSMDAMTRAIDTANKVLNSPGFTGYFDVNLMPGTNRWIPGTDTADTRALVDTLKSQGFMSGIQQMRGLGALSNAEGQKVMDAIGNLSASQSEKSARTSIKTIIDTTQMAQKRLQQKYGKDIPAQQPNQQQSQLSDDDLVNKYLGGR